MYKTLWKTPGPKVQGSCVVMAGKGAHWLRCLPPASCTQLGNYQDSNPHVLYPKALAFLHAVFLLFHRVFSLRLICLWGSVAKAKFRHSFSSLASFSPIKLGHNPFLPNQCIALTLIHALFVGAPGIWSHHCQKPSLKCLFSFMGLWEKHKQQGCLLHPPPLHSTTPTSNPGLPVPSSDHPWITRRQHQKL